MSAPDAQKQPSALPIKTLMVALSSVILVAHLVVAMGNNPEAFEGYFFDGDSYMRLMQVGELAETGNWLDRRFMRANAPFGYETHWTRPFDLLLLLVAAPAIPFIGTLEAIEMAGTVISPLLHAAMALILVWAVRPLLGWAGAIVAGVLTIAQVGLMKLGTFGVADHHMLFVLLTVLALGLFVRVLSGDGEITPAATGALGAFGIWVGPEMLLFVALGLSVTGLAWCFGHDPGGKRNRALTRVLLAGTLLATLADRGPDAFTVVEFDRISIVYATLTALLFLGWLVISSVERRMGSAALATGHRIAVGSFVAAAIAAVMMFLYPGVVRGPEAGIDPAIYEIFDRAYEYMPMDDPADILGYIGTAIFALPYLVWQLWCQRKHPTVWSWCLVALALIVYLAFTLTWIRWAVYAGVFLAIALAGLVTHLDRLFNARLTQLTRIPAKVGTYLIIILAPLVSSGTIAAKEEAASSAPPCPTKNLTRLLAAPPWSEEGRTILAATNFGPEILYRTPHRVVATLHHRNQDGILGSRRIFRAQTDDQALQGIRQRGVSLILLCKNDGAAHFYDSDDSGILFYERLEHGNPPSWLEEVALPEGPLNAFRMFIVN